MKFLVVDDSITMRRIIRSSIEQIGYSSTCCLEASDGLEGLKILNEQPDEINLVLADWNMPGMDGLTMLRRLQENEATKHIPVIMITGEAQRNRVVEAMNAGARNYIVKPFTTDIIRQKILALEIEQLSRSRLKPTDTAVIRFERSDQLESESGRQSFMAQLPEELVAGIYESGEILHRPEGLMLVEPDDVVESLCFVERGSVDVFAASDRRLIETRGPGHCYGETSFLSGDPSGISVRAGEGLTILKVSRSNFEQLVSEFPNLSYFLTKLLATHAHEEESPEPISSELTGRLDMMTLAEVIQTLYTNKKTGALYLTWDNRKGEVHIEEGKVRHADSEDGSGEEAFYSLMNWPDGQFRFAAETETFEPNIFRGTMNLLMEGMRRRDEQGR